jgi:thioesterase domain-containing protein
MNPDDLIHIVEDFERRSGGSGRIDGRPTIFLFPGLDGDEPRLTNLRAGLSDRFRIIPIEYPDWPEMVRRSQSFDALVDLAVSQITAAQPGGPLLLAGYSFGGDVAFATATRLLRLERRIGFLGILDTDLQRGCRGGTVE